jgi:UDP-N-acetyl-D-glucosamine dehydrogenase
VREVNSSLTIVGLGYVGLPLAQEACRSGLRVVGLDTDPSVVSGLSTGLSHIDDIDSVDLAKMARAGFLATTDSSCIRGSDVVVICVPTPLDEDGTPDLGAVKAATTAVSEHLQPGSLVILESTTYPGTTEDIVRPILEAGSGLAAGTDFWLAYSPERIDPGNPEWGLRNTPKVVGGLTPACTEQAVQFYDQIVDTVVPTVGTREAELAKLLENTYRHVNIALMNEMAVFCHELGIDLWAGIEAAKTKPFGFEAFYPGPGVGGHCIPIDPNYLSWVVRSVGYRFRFVELAEEISARMPAYVAQRVQDLLNVDKKPVNGSVVLLLGVTYKANVSDQRETPARPLAACLSAMGAEVRYFDPHADTFTFNGRELVGEDDLEEALGKADVGVLVQAHNEIIESGALKLARRILDTRGVLSGDNVERL